MRSCFCLFKVEVFVFSIKCCFIVSQFTTKDGLSNIDVWTIVEGNDGNIWVGARGGLFRYHPPSGRFVDYTHKLNR